MSTTSLPTLFVSGAGGQLGRRVIELLRERGYAGRLIAGSRHPDRLDAEGIEPRKADFSDPAGLIEALRGVERMLLISTDVVGPARTGLHANAVAAAKAAGVGHIVYTSMAAPEPGSPVPFAPEHYETEQAIKASGLGYTILRNLWYSETLFGPLASALASGQWFSAAGEGRTAYVSREDCARAAAGALLGGKGSETLTVTGPEALTTRQVAAMASRVTGRPIEVVDVSDEALAAGARAAGIPEAAIDTFIVPLDVNTRLARFDRATDSVERLWGTRPQGLESFLADHRAALGA